MSSSESSLTGTSGNEDIDKNKIKNINTETDKRYNKPPTSTQYPRSKKKKKIIAQDSYPRHELQNVYNKSDFYIIGNSYLSFYLLRYIHRSGSSIVINNGPGTGKTSYFKVTQELEEQKPNNFVMKYIKPEDKDEVIRLCNKLLVFNIDCKSLLKEAEKEHTNSPQRTLEECFVHRVIVEIVQKFIIRVKLSKEATEQLNQFKANSDILFHDIKTSPLTQTSIHNELIKYIIGLITDGNGITKRGPIDNTNSNSTERTITRTDQTRIERIIFLIDEANIFRTKNICSSLLGKEYNHRNFMVTLFDQALSFDTDGTTIKNLQFVFASVLPISTEKNITENNWSIRSFHLIVDENIGCSFGEINYRQFKQIVYAQQKDGETNRLNELMKNAIEGPNAIDPFLSTTMSIETRQIFKKEWDELFPENLYDEHKIPFTEEEVINKLHQYFLWFFRQVVYRVKNDLEEMKRILIKNTILTRAQYENEKSNSDETKLENVFERDYTIKCEFLINFLMGHDEANQISDRISEIAPGEIKLDEYFGNFIEFKKKRKNRDFAHKVDEEIIDLIYEPPAEIPIDYYHRTLFESYHLGFTSIFIKLEMHDEYAFDFIYKFIWISPIHRKKIREKFEEYKEVKKSLFNFSADEKSKLRKAFTLEFFKDVITEVVTKTNIDMNLIADSAYQEKDVRNRMGIHFKDVIKDKVKSECDYADEKGLNTLVSVKPEVRVNKVEPEDQKRDTARIDLAVRLAMGPDPQDKLRVVIELKKDYGTIHDHTVMKEGAKNYDKLDFLGEEGKILYLSASMNTKDKRKKRMSDAFSYFLSDNIDAKKPK